MTMMSPLAKSSPHPGPELPPDFSLRSVLPFTLPEFSARKLVASNEFHSELPRLEKSLAALLAHVDKRLVAVDAAAEQRHSEHMLLLERFRQQLLEPVCEQKGKGTVPYKIVKREESITPRSPRSPRRDGCDYPSEFASLGFTEEVQLLLPKVEDPTPLDKDLELPTPRDIDIIKRIRSCIANHVQSIGFDVTVGFAILFNAVFIGLSVEHKTRAPTEQLPLAYEIANHFFCLAFLTEITLRAMVYQSTFVSYVLRNSVDTAVLVLTLAEESVLLFRYWCCGTYHHTLIGIGVLRIARVFRLFRIVRFPPPVLRYIADLRVLIVTITDSLHALLWAIVLLVFTTFLGSVILTEMVNKHNVYGREDHDQPIFAYFGSLGNTMLSLYQVVLDGITFGEITNALREGCPFWVPFVFLVYTTCCKLALMNIVTSIFVTKAMKHAEDDVKQIQMELFLHDADRDGSGKLSLQEFKDNMHHPIIKEMVGDMTPETAQAVFQLLDADSSGQISIEELVSSCMNMQRQALLKCYIKLGLGE